MCGGAVHAGAQSRGYLFLFFYFYFFLLLFCRRSAGTSERAEARWRRALSQSRSFFYTFYVSSYGAGTIRSGASERRGARRRGAESHGRHAFLPSRARSTSGKSKKFLGARSAAIERKEMLALQIYFYFF